MGWGPPGRVEPRLSRLESEYTAVSEKPLSFSLFPLVLNNPMLFLGLDGICQHHESLIFADWSPQAVMEECCGCYWKCNCNDLLC